MVFTLKLKVMPGASRTEVAGWLGDVLKVRVSAQPELFGLNGQSAKRLVRLPVLLDRCRGFSTY